MERKRVSLVHSDAYSKEMSFMPRVEERALIVIELIKAYGLLDYVNIIDPKQASEEDIKSFHSEEYVDFLKAVDSVDDIEKSYDLREGCQEFGLDYDCPLMDKLYRLVSWQVGGTLSAVRALVEGLCSVAINWEGGWHHAKRDEAAGFCYVNDPVIGILHLRKKFDRVLYIDLDLHHGDGVEEAFAVTPKVMCVSFHKYESGFYPGTGSVNSKGYGKGRYYTVNVPLHDGITDEKYSSIVIKVLEKVRERFSPHAVVCQCGVDTLNNDPMDSFNLTSYGIGKCLQYLLSWKLPLLLLGGGGYNSVNAARCWTYLTSLVVGVELGSDIPDHKFFLKYGPDYDLTITPGNRPDNNSEQYLSQLIETILGNIKYVS